MNKQLIFRFILCCIFAANTAFSQDLQNSVPAVPTISALFMEEKALPVKISYSHRELRKKTNDSTYINTDLYYLSGENSWDSINVKIRARGNYRLEHCYYPPVKMKIKKSVAKGTLFQGNKELKVVLPCLNQKNTNDNVVKEYLAYKLYETISPYHFKTRMLEINFDEISGKKVKNHQIKGFMIEDIDKVAARHNAKKIKRAIHPLEQDNICSVQNDFFQYMIANTDFSVAYQHNEKLIFANGKKAMPVPYDFDMSGLVNASYAVVSTVQNEPLNITKVTQRLFRGFKRDEAIYQQVRRQFLDNKTHMLDIVDSFETSFEDPRQFSTAKRFIQDFFVVLSSDDKFKSQILRKARTK